MGISLGTYRRAMHGPVARCARCDIPYTPFRPLVLSHWGKPYCSSCCGFVMAEHDRPPPSPPTRRDTPSEAWEGRQLIGEKPVADWPWKEIQAADRQAQQRAAKAPKCRACGQPLLCGLTDLHWTCRPT